MLSDLVFKPAHELAQMIRDRAVSVVEVLDTYLAQIAKHNVFRLFPSIHLVPKLFRT